jgi:hypothetical protein
MIEFRDRCKEEGFSTETSLVGIVLATYSDEHMGVLENTLAGSVREATSSGAGVSRSTVRVAPAILRDEGVVITIAARGTFVK